MSILIFHLVVRTPLRLFLIYHVYSSIENVFQFSLGLPGDSDNKESAWNSGDSGLIPGWGRSHGKGNGNPSQYSCLENSMDRGSWHATIHGVAKNQT